MREYVWVSWLYNSSITRPRQKALHRKDMWTTWFGVPLFQRKPCLYTYPRLQNLLQLSDKEDIGVQYPSMVSFFGETGAGKSRLIMALIRNAGAVGMDFEVPVPGNLVDFARSTSGDVHMYADPCTLSTAVPLLYVGMCLPLILVCGMSLLNASSCLDCEGLRGTLNPTAKQDVSSETPQRQHLQKKTLRPAARPSTFAVVRDNIEAVLKASNPVGKSYAQEVEEHRRTSSNRPYIQWANIVHPPMSIPIGIVQQPDEEPRIDDESAKLIVTELYPRLLYTFSDVVCYVTTNIK